MDNVRPVKQIINFVIPFSFTEPYRCVFEDLEQSHQWEEDTSTKRENIMEHIDVLIRRDKSKVDAETIGRQYVLTQKGRVDHGLQKNVKDHYTYHYTNKNASEPFEFSISSIKLMLFETQIGFLVYSINYKDGMSIKEVVEHNYFLKNFSKNYGEISYQPKIVNTIYSYLEEKGIVLDRKEIRPKMKYGKKPKDIIKEFSELDIQNDYSHLNEEEVEALADKVQVVNLSSLSRDLVNALKPDTFFHEYEKDNQRFPSYALIYNALTMDQSFVGEEDKSLREDFIKDTLFKMRRSFKGSYKPCARDLQLEGSDEVFQAFENSYWGFSLEGVANLSFLVEDESTNNFFLSNYYGNLERSYFYLYLIALHQRYALIKLSKEATLLPISINNLMEDENNHIDRLRERIAYFNLRSAFKHVSHISHQDKVYQLMHKSLNVDDLMMKIDSEVQSIGSLVDLQKEQRHKESENIFVGLSIVFVVISTISGIWPLFDEFLLPQIEREFFFISSVLIALFGIAIIRTRGRILTGKKRVRVKKSKINRRKTNVNTNVTNASIESADKKVTRKKEKQTA